MKQIILILCLSCCAFAKAQLQSANWYFGINAGIDFNSGSAVPTNDGQLVTGEGCATISDEVGNLLFYTDGSLVYDASHNIMPNGSGLKGNSSSTSSAIIVPQPGNPRLFYIFTVDTDDLNYTNNEGFHYSIVDMDLNAGLGDVDPANKNINLLPLVSEKLTAISNASGDGFWVITQFEDNYFAYSITAAGLNPTPVISQVTPFIELVNTNFSNVDVAAMRGYIKVNARGNKLVAAHFSNNNSAEFSGITSINFARSTAYANGGELYLYDFDNATGVISNPQPLMTRSDGASFYGVEFSPNGRYLYAEADYMTPSVTQIFDFDRGEILQFDLTASNIAGSRTLVHQDNFNTFRGALQLGLDGQIYHSRINESALSVINDPDAAGPSANYVYNQFALAPNTIAWYGLPIFVQSFLLDGSINANNHCFGEPQVFEINTSANIVSVNWDFGDPNSGLANTSTELMPTHLFSAPGTYTVRVIVDTLVQVFELEIDIEVFENVSLDLEITPLSSCDTGFDKAVFDLTEVAQMVIDLQPNLRVSFYESSEDANLGINAIMNTDTYVNQYKIQELYVRVENDNCFQVIPFIIQVEECTIEIFNVVTPDGDGRNDTLIVSGLRNIYDNFKLYIFSRYGQKVWVGSNKTQDWDGTSNTGLFSPGKRLPTGTYFYILELNEPNQKPLSGYVYLQ
ncbi:T9SS type B sorting domain-containing protein [Nonlabens xiamenensis]|uniref:T9SS type B sorting domain-containing protein n=1 Tax=Nonlabens xiamenensis TaxID=2341043 RepID=UPI000F6153B5|nr:gliding motility-associated C-terminal domain-containing protein [Nonlabens xiamenensis]